MTIGTIIDNGRRQLSTGIPGVDEDDIVIETGDITAYGTHLITIISGGAHIEASLDGINFSTPLALEDLQSTNPALRVTSLVQPNRVYSFLGFYRNVRVMQDGGTPAIGAFMISL